MNNRQAKILVIGLGNTLRGDDALGRIAAQRLRSVVDLRTVTIIDQCAPTPELAAEIGGASLVFFLDASIDGPTDQIVTSCLTASETAQAMAHRYDALTLLGLSQQLYGHVPETFAITFRGDSFDFSDCQLSPRAEVACDTIVEQTLRLIAGHRHQPEVDNLSLRGDSS